MATTTLVFVILGVSVASVNLMKLVEWLDTPQSAHRARRAV